MKNNLLVQTIESYLGNCSSDGIYMRSANTDTNPTAGIDVSIDAEGDFATISIREWRKENGQTSSEEVFSAEVNDAKTLSAHGSDANSPMSEQDASIFLDEMLSGRAFSPISKQEA